MRIPKITLVALFLVLPLITSADNRFWPKAQATSLITPILAENHGDWTSLFPQIPGCEQKIYPINISADGKSAEQTASYQQNGAVCGSITLWLKLSLKKDRQEDIKKNFEPTTQKIQIKNFEAYRHSPLCGNDDLIGSIEVLFDEDKSFTVSANRGSQDILKLAETIDYERLKQTMSEPKQLSRKN